MHLLGYPEYRTRTFESRKRIATKYPNVAKNYFSNKQENVEIIKLEGSVELGPVIGMTDAIVDIVETGSTLKANRTRNNWKNKWYFNTINIK